MTPSSPILRTHRTTAPQALAADIAAAGQTGHQHVTVDLRQSAGSEHIESLVSFALAESPDVALSLLLPEAIVLSPTLQKQTTIAQPPVERHDKIIDGYVGSLRHSIHS